MAWLFNKNYIFNYIYFCIFAVIMGDTLPRSVEECRYHVISKVPNQMNLILMTTLQLSKLIQP